MRRQSDSGGKIVNRGGVASVELQIAGKIRYVLHNCARFLLFTVAQLLLMITGVLIVGIFFHRKPKYTKSTVTFKGKKWHGVGFRYVVQLCCFILVCFCSSRTGVLVVDGRGALRCMVPILPSPSKG